MQNSLRIFKTAHIVKCAIHNINYYIVRSEFKIRLLFFETRYSLTPPLYLLQTQLFRYIALEVSLFR